MKNRIKLIALILGILIALAFPLAGANAVVEPDGDYCQDEHSSVKISDTIKAYIKDRNQNLEKNCKGSQICVLVLDTIGNQRIEDYSALVFEQWKMGRSGENNGVLLLMAIEDKDYYILPGSGLSSVLSTKTLSDISRNAIEPSFRDGKYDAAVDAGFRRLNEAVCKHYNVDPFAVVSGSSEPFSGNGSGIFDLGSGFSWLSGELPAGPMLDCVSCLFCGSCGSCGGIGGLIFGLFVIYVILQVLKYVGRGTASRVNRVRSAIGSFVDSNSGQARSSGSTNRASERPHHTTHRPPFGGFNAGGARAGEKK